MRTLKRLGTGLLATGVAAVGMLMTAPMASAHNTMLSATSHCQEDGTYLVTYSGSTAATGGRIANLTVSQVLPAGTSVSGAPAHVVGNTNYGFTQTVPGDATSASVRVDLIWPADHATAHASATARLGGDCNPPTPVAPSGDLATDCVEGGGHVVASDLDSGTAENVTWRLVSGTDGSHNTVVAGPTANGPLEASGLPDATKVWLQYKVGNGDWVDEGSVVTTGNCTPPTPVAPSGDLATDCVEGGGHVVASDLDSGTAENVTWRLVSGTDGSHNTVVAGPTANGPLEASGLPDATKVWLQYAVGNGDWVDEGSVVTTGDCTPPVVTPPGGSFTVVCSDTGANVTIGTLTSGSKPDVVWTLTYGSASKTVSTGDVVAVPSGAALALSFTAGDETSGTVQTGTAPDACQNTDVLGEHHSRNPSSPTDVLGVSLAHTGAPAQLPGTLGFAGLFLLAGSAMIFLARRPEKARVPSNDLN